MSIILQGQRMEGEYLMPVIVRFKGLNFKREEVKAVRVRIESAELETMSGKIHTLVGRDAVDRMIADNRLGEDHSKELEAEFEVVSSEDVKEQLALGSGE